MESNWIFWLLDLQGLYYVFWPKLRQNLTPEQTVQLSSVLRFWVVSFKIGASYYSYNSILYRDAFKDFANVLHLTLIEKSYVLNRKSIEKGLPTVRHPLKIHFPKSKSI